MAETIDFKLLDKRTFDRYLTNGQLDEKAWERHLKSLPDLAERAAVIETTIEEEELEDDVEEPAGA